MLPVLQVGPLAIQLDGLLILAGLWCGLLLAERQAKRSGIKPNDLYNLVFIALLSGLLGARLSYLLRYPQAFAASPLSLISPNPGLLDPLGGSVAAGLAGLIYAQRKGLPTWAILDALTPLLAVLQLFLGFAHLASGAAFGAAADLPWALELWGARRHPSQVYEILAAGFILALVWPGHGPIRSQKPGGYFFAFLALSAGAHLFLEAFRGDSYLLAGGLRAAQLAAWLILAISLTAIYRLNKPLGQD